MTAGKHTAKLRTERIEADDIKVARSSRWRGHFARLAEVLRTQAPSAGADSKEVDDDTLTDIDELASAKPIKLYMTMLMLMNIAEQIPDLKITDADLLLMKISDDLLDGQALLPVVVTRGVGR